MLPDLDTLAVENGFSGVVRIGNDRAAWGLADRAHQISNTTATRFALASGTKTFTALSILRLVENGTLQLGTTARSVLGGDLPLVDDDVTIEQLLAHRSGIGDYLDESATESADAYVMPIPVHRLATTEDYLEVLGGHEQLAAPGSEFCYCNSGYVVLALLAERAAGSLFPDLVEELVCRPAGLAQTGFDRMDEPRGDTAVGYLDSSGPRTNVLHLPVRGSGDGGLFSSLDDIHALWAALFDAKIVGEQWLREMIRPRSTTESGAHRYGFGLWMDGSGTALQMEGADAGISFRSVCDPADASTWTVMSNTSDGAWPVARRIAAR